MPSTPNDGDGSSAGDGREQADAEGLRRTYLDEYFFVIRDRIVKNLVFPPYARKMGWSGKAAVSFVICRNGHVENVRIVETTGHAVLDRQVVEAVRQVAPFPYPPIEAEITLPIVFRLL